MNFTVTGEPAPSQLDQKRKTLLQSMLNTGPGSQRLMAGRGLARAYTAADSPNAAVPGLTFNPFLAQLQRGVGGLQAPSQQTRGLVDDLTGTAGAASTGGAGAVAGAPTSDAAAPTDLTSAYQQAGIDPSTTQGISWLGSYYDPTMTTAPPVAPPLSYLRPSLGYPTTI